MFKAVVTQMQGHVEKGLENDYIEQCGTYDFVKFIFHDLQETYPALSGVDEIFMQLFIQEYYVHRFSIDADFLLPGSPEEGGLERFTLNYDEPVMDVYLRYREAA